KIHHALIDGVSAQKLMQRALSTDPEETEMRAPWTLPKSKRKRSPVSPLRSALNAAGSIAALGPSSLSLARAALFEQQLTLPFGAPRT
ncbi:wax ester/triacylglycerol synthase domain-containing protein, partial [Mycobacterium kansasii]